VQRNPASATRTNDGRLPIDPPFLTVLRELRESVANRTSSTTAQAHGGRARITIEGVPLN
jgi:hypothetical protein